ncbi:MAG: hypothetical protein JXR82_10885 [Marinifilaceae bacterium]|nr:hypothetical protein [Marinifilaceae bacterium]
MQRIDLSDVTFLIPVRIDSAERLENTELVVKYIKSNFLTNLIVLEASDTERVINKFIDKKIFIKDVDPIFHHTKYRNILSEHAKSKILAFWDTDIIALPKQIEEGTQTIRDNNSSFVLPYDGRVFKVDPVLRKLYSEHKDLDFIIQNQEKMFLMFGHFSEGGVFMVKRNQFNNTTKENENFYGWGPEDAERVKRWEILGHHVERITGPIFHLHHPRKENSWYFSKEQEIKNRQEFIKICSMGKYELHAYLENLS